MDEIPSRGAGTTVTGDGDGMARHQREIDIVLTIKADEREDDHVPHGFETDDYQNNSIRNTKINKKYE